MKRAFIVLNPEAGRGRGRRVGRSIVEAFEANGWTVEMRSTSRAGEERDLAREATSAGWPVVVAAGGDGTVHGTANGIIDTDSRATTLGVVALGTGNDFVKLTGHAGKAVGKAVRHLTRSRPRLFDLGCVNGEYFTNGLGIGFDTAVIDQMRKMPRLRGFALYLAAVYRAFAKFQPPTIEITSETHSETSPMMLAEISIGTTAGGGFRLTPDADPTDGLLDVCVIRKIGLPAFLRYVPRVIIGKHANLPPVKLFRTASVRVGTPGLPLAVHLDGEIRHFETDSVDVTVVPERLGVLCGT